MPYSAIGITTSALMIWPIDSGMPKHSFSATDMMLGLDGEQQRR